MAESVSVDSLMFEVEERTVTLRVEEWITIATLLELSTSRTDVPDPDALLVMQKRIIRQMLHGNGNTDAPPADL